MKMVFNHVKISGNRLRRDELFDIQGFVYQIVSSEDSSKKSKSIFWDLLLQLQMLNYIFEGILTAFPNVSGAFRFCFSRIRLCFEGYYYLIDRCLWRNIE